eukprot:Skav206020  [mRNA]  locus=scaffold4083:30462:32270:+ [translate_table: standard]
MTPWRRPLTSSGKAAMFDRKDNECLLIVFGGALWALSNYLVLPLVKLLGIGLGFSLYHFVNLMVGYAVGRFEIFGMEKLRGNLLVCAARNGSRRFHRLTPLK